MEVANTLENNAKIKALKKIAETKWTGNTVHDNMDKCLRALNNESNNSGHYNPVAARIPGLTGCFMINQDGGIFCEARIIKQDEKKYLIEYMTNEGWSMFERYFCDFLE